MDVSRATRRVDRSVAPWAPTVLRVSAGLVWLSNVSWKVPPDFGDSAGGCSGLCGYVGAGAEDAVLPGSTWLFDSVVGPHLAVFGWLTLFVEAGLAAALLSGRFVRVAAVVGLVQSVGIGLAVANAEGEWYWSYGLMIALHLAILALAPVARRTTPAVMAGCLAGYGVVVGLAHTTGGLTGDGSFTLFEQANDVPGDFGRNVFPGSIALGLVLVLVAAAVALVARRAPEAAEPAGYALVVVAALLLVTYGQDGLVLGLGSRATTASVLAAAGLALTGGPPTRRSGSREGGSRTDHRTAPA